MRSNPASFGLVSFLLFVSESSRARVGRVSGTGALLEAVGAKYGGDGGRALPSPG